MPIYEFLCGCGHRFEKLCKMNDKPFPNVLHAGAKAVR